MASLNYMHEGCTKTWYAMPMRCVAALERAVYEEALPEKARHALGLLMHKAVVVEPHFLQKRGVKVYRAQQRAGDLILTGPRCYHSGFSHGFNLGEAINVAPLMWVPYGMSSVSLMRVLSRVSVLDMERLLFDSCREGCDPAVRSCARSIASRIVGTIRGVAMECQRLGIDVLPMSQEADMRVFCEVCSHVCHAAFFKAPADRDEIAVCIHHYDWLVRNLQQRAVDDKPALFLMRNVNIGCNQVVPLVRASPIELVAPKCVWETCPDDYVAGVPTFDAASDPLTPSVDNVSRELGFVIAARCRRVELSIEFRQPVGQADIHPVRVGQRGIDFAQIKLEEDAREEREATRG